MVLTGWLEGLVLRAGGDVTGVVAGTEDLPEVVGATGLLGSEGFGLDVCAVRFVLSGAGVLMGVPTVSAERRRDVSDGSGNCCGGKDGAMVG